MKDMQFIDPNHNLGDPRNEAINQSLKDMLHDEVRELLENTNAINEEV